MGAEFEKLKTKYRQEYFDEFCAAVGKAPGVLHFPSRGDKRFGDEYDGGSIKWEKRGSLADREGELVALLAASAQDAYGALEREAMGMPGKKLEAEKGGEDDDDDEGFSFEDKLSGKLLAMEMVLDSMIDLVGDGCGQASRFAAVKALSEAKIPVDPRKLLLESLGEMLRGAGDAQAAKAEVDKAHAALFDPQASAAAAENERWRIYDPMHMFGQTKEDGRNCAYAAADALQLLNKAPELSQKLCEIFGVCADPKWRKSQHERAGRSCAESIGWRGVKGGKIDAGLAKALKMPFVAGFMGYYGYDSKSGKAAFEALAGDLEQRLGKLEQGDPKRAALEAYAVGAVWAGLDRKKIEAFEERFPGLADARLSQAIESRFSSSQTDWIYLERALNGSGGAKWAKKHFDAFAQGEKIKLYGCQKENALEEIVRSFRAVHAGVVKDRIDPGKPGGACGAEKKPRGKAKAKPAGKRL